MSVLVVGLSHHTAPVSLLERAVVPTDAVGKLLDELADLESAAEIVVLSTCNRVEIYADVDKFHPAVAAISDLLARHTGLGLEALTPHLYVHYEDRAVQHLFSVACGLDSMVVGESQILGQVKSALRTAQEGGAAGRVLNDLVQQAIRVGKRAHAETDIDQAGASLVSVALDHADRLLGGLAGRSGLVIGAGSMSSLAAATLRRAGLVDVVVTSRTPDHAAEIAGDIAGRVVPMNDLEQALASADIVVSCTGATGLVVSAEVIARAVAARARRRLVIVDLALPRDVDPHAASIPGVAVIDLERLADVLEPAAAAQSTADASPGANTATNSAVAEVSRIIGEEVASFAGLQRAARVAPTVVALRSMAAEVVDLELARLDNRLPALSDGERDEVRRTVNRVVDKLLHAPTVRVKELGGEPAATTYAEALRELFGLDPAAVESVVRPAPISADLLTDPADRPPLLHREERS